MSLQITTITPAVPPRRDRWCIAVGCDRPYVLRDMCRLHYQRSRYRPPRTLEEMYESKVDRSPGSDGCHPWLASKNKFDYGMFNHDGESLAARWAYKRFIGPLSEADVVRHTCDNPECQNRAHWIRGSQHQNILDAVERDRQWRPRGSRNVKAKLTETQVKEIRAARGVPRQRLAAMYGVAGTTIWQILSRRTWAHI